MPGRRQPRGQFVIVGEQAGMLLAERDHDGAGQRREVDHELRLEAVVAVPERIGQHEAAFGVGVEDLDGLARHRGDDVAGPLGIAVDGMFSTRPTMPTTLTLALRAASACISPVTAAAPPMSPFMSSMPAAGLIEMPPVSKVTPLPTKATGLSLALPPFHCMTTRRGAARRALRDAEQRAHAELPHFLLGQDLDLDAELLELLGLGGELDRAENVGRLVDQIARQIDAVGNRLGVGESLLGGGRIGAVDGDLGRLCGSAPCRRRRPSSSCTCRRCRRAAGCRRRRRAASAPLASISGRSSTTATSAALRNCAGNRAAELQPAHIRRGSTALPAPIATSRSSAAALGRDKLDNRARTCRRIPQSRKPDREPLPDRRPWRPRSSRPFSAERTTTLPFFGAVILAKPMEGLEVMKGPAVLGNYVAGATFGGFAAFGKTPTPAMAKLHGFCGKLRMQNPPYPSQEDQLQLSVNRIRCAFLSHSRRHSAQAWTPMPGTNWTKPVVLPSPGGYFVAGTRPLCGQERQPTQG